jgi:hypothetical protein
MPTAEDLSLQSRPFPSQLLDLSDEQLHGVDSKSGEISVDSAIRRGGQHEVIHSTDSCHTIPETSGNARAQQGLDYGRFSSGKDPPDVNCDLRSL